MTIELAKRLVNDLNAAITKRAQEAYPGLSSQQAYTKFIETPEGKTMFKSSLRSARSVEQAAQDFVPEQKSFGPAGKEIARLAAEMGRAKSISLQESFSRVVSDPKHADLVRAEKEEVRRATDSATRQRWPMRSAERDSKTREWLDAR